MTVPQGLTPRHGALGFVVVLGSLAFPSPAAAQPAGERWEGEVLASLCAKYASDCGRVSSPSESEVVLNQVAVAVGRRLAAEGLSAVEAQDVASLALLLSTRNAGRPPSPATRAAPPAEPSAPAPVSSPATGSAQAAGSGQAAGETFADVSKGQEGFVQGVERLASLPVAQRMVITGDITAGVQAATVSGGSDLTSTFGRVRVNFVTRAVPGSPGGRYSDGFFLVQMRAAGGPFDTTPVGGPPPFSSLNDVATDRSRFNEGTSRGNLYLAKAFYQQEFNLRGGNLAARVGIINLSDFFDTSEFANNEARQFLNSAFVNSVAYKTGISAPGFMGEFTRRVDRDWLREIVLRAGYAVSRTERAFTSPISSMEAEVQTRVRGYNGRYRIGGTIGNVAGVGGVRGIHLGADQWISPRFGVYGRYAWSNSGPGSLFLGPVTQSYSGGAQWRFVQQGDRVSAWAFGFSQAFGSETPGAMASERALETYYRWQLSEKFALTPDLQLVLGSGGRRTRGTHLVGGVRMSFGF